MKDRELEIEVTKEGKLPVTKVDAAVRQLETAIKLWFHDADPVSIATLGFAGYRIISDLNNLQGGDPMVMDGGNYIKNEYKRAFRRLMRDTPNFFKHADQDPHETHYFSPDVTIILIFEAIAVYSSWKMEARPLFHLFHLWMALESPQLFKDDYIREIKNIGDTDSFLNMGKRKYYKMALPAFMNIF